MQEVDGVRKKCVTFMRDLVLVYSFTILQLLDEEYQLITFGPKYL